jgi:hypothetical protein
MALNRLLNAWRDRVPVEHWPLEEVDQALDWYVRVKVKHGDA